MTVKVLTFRQLRNICKYYYATDDPECLFTSLAQVLCGDRPVLCKEKNCRVWRRFKQTLPPLPEQTPAHLVLPSPRSYRPASSSLPPLTL